MLMTSLLNQKNKNIFLYLLMKMLFSFHLGIIGSIYILFFYKNGFGKLETNILSSFFSIFVFVFEIPSGVLCDFFGRKKFIILSGIFLTVSMFLFSYSKSFIFLAVAQSFWGISAAIESGSVEAWLIDTDLSSEKSLEKIFAITQKYINIIGFINGIITVYISAYWSFAIPWKIAFISAILFTGVSFFINDTQVKHYKEKNISILFSDIAHQFIDNKIAISIMIYSCFYAIGISPVFTFWSPIFYDLAGGNLLIISYIWIFIKICNAIGNYIVQKIAKKKKSDEIFICALVVSSIMCFVGGYSRNFWIAIVSFLVFEISCGVITPIYFSRLNSIIQNHTRASILSIASMAERIGSTVALFVFGYVAQSLSMFITWIIASIILMMTACYYYNSLYDRI